MSLKQVVFIAALVGCLLPARGDLIEGRLIENPLLGDPDAEAEAVGQWTGTSLTFLAKFEPDKPSTGFLRDYFTVEGVEGGRFHKEGKVSWNLSGTGWAVHYVLLKDGSVPGTQADLQYYYLYKVSEVQEIINLVGDRVAFDGADRDISHITFLGAPTGVPEAMLTAWYLGLSLLGLGLTKRGLLGFRA
jgi:hypothetical protein